MLFFSFIFLIHTFSVLDTYMWLEIKKYLFDVLVLLKILHFAGIII